MAYRSGIKMEYNFYKTRVVIELFYSVKVSEVLLRIVSEWQEVGTDFENM